MSVLGSDLPGLEIGAKAGFYLAHWMLDGSHGWWRCSLAGTTKKMQIPNAVKAESPV